MMERYCTQCGKTIDEKAAFCSFCGAKVTDSNPEINSTYRKSYSTIGKSKKKRLIIFPVVLMIMVVAGVSIFFLTSFVKTKLTGKLGNSQGNMQCFGETCYDGKDIYFGTASCIYRIDSNGKREKILLDTGWCHSLCNIENQIIYTEEIILTEGVRSFRICSLNKRTEKSSILLDLGIHNKVYILNSLNDKIYYNIMDADSDGGEDLISTYVYDLKTGRSEYFLDFGYLMTEKGIYYYSKNETDYTIMFRSFESNSEKRIIQIDALPILQINNFLLLKTYRPVPKIYRFDLKTEECIPIFDNKVDFVIDYNDDLLWSDFYHLNKCDINGNNTLELACSDTNEPDNMIIPSVVNGKIVYFSLAMDDNLQFVKLSEKTNAEEPSKGSEETGFINDFEPGEENYYGNTPENLRNGGYVASQGDWVYYSCHEYDQLIKMKKDGSEKTVLLQQQGLYDYNHIQVIGDWIYFATLTGDTQNTTGNKFFKIKTDGSELTELTELSEATQQSTMEELTMTRPYNYPIVVGNFIYYKSYISLDRSTQSVNISRMTTDGNDSTIILDMSGLLYNSTSDFHIITINDQWIYFVETIRDNYNTTYDVALWRVKLDGSSPEQISPYEYFSSATHTPSASDLPWFISYPDGFVIENRLFSNNGIYYLDLDSLKIISPNNATEIILQNLLKDNYIGIANDKLTSISKDFSNKQKINNDNATMIFTDGEWIYYTYIDGMCRVHVDGTGWEELIRGKYE